MTTSKQTQLAAAVSSKAPWRPDKQVLMYLAVTYALALALALAFPHKEMGALLTILVPITSTAVTMRFTADRNQRRAFWRAVGFKVPRVFAMALAVVVPLAVTAISFGAATVAGLVSFPALGPGLAKEQLHILIMVAIFTVVMLGEEVGWRGFLLFRMAEMMSGRHAALLTGACHAAFHLPLLLLTTTYQGAGNRWIVVPMIMGTLTLAGVWYGWVRLRTGSIWPVNVSHATFNAVMEAAGTAAIVGTASTMAYVTTESGVFTLLAVAFLAAYLWRFRSADFRIDERLQRGHHVNTITAGPRRTEHSDDPGATSAHQEDRRVNRTAQT